VLVVVVISCSGSNSGSVSGSSNLCLVLTVLEATFRLTQGCHGGSSSPFDTYDFMFTLVFSYQTVLHEIF